MILLAVYVIGQELMIVDCYADAIMRLPVAATILQLLRFMKKSKLMGMWGDPPILSTGGLSI